MRKMIRRLAPTLVVTLAIGCTATVSLDGLTGGAPDGDAGGSDANQDADQGADARSADASDGGPLPGLLYWYRFDGNGRDSSGRDIDGVVSGKATLDQPGVVGQALTCTGNAGDGFVVGGDFHPGTSSFSVALFYRLTVPKDAGWQGGDTLFEKGCQWQNSQCAEPGFGIGVDRTSPSLHAFVLDQQAVKARWMYVGYDDVATVSTTFHHAAFVVDRESGAIRLYFDGLRHGETMLPADFGSVDSTRTGRVCAQGDPNITLAGAVDELMIFGRVLTDAEIRTLSTAR